MRAGVSIFGKAIGAGIAISPTYRGLNTLITGSGPTRLQDAFGQISFDMVGIDPQNPQTQLDIGRVIATGVTVAVGIGIMKLFSYIARQV